jgi:hypothetical protein
MKLRRRFAGSSALLLALLAACPSGDDTSAAPPTQDAGEEPFDICTTFPFDGGGAGKPCSPVSSTVCFRECKTDGCMCVAGPDGGGIWSCQNDFSCTPEAGPLVGTGAGDVTPAPDGSTVDASDAGTAGDSGEAG